MNDIRVLPQMTSVSSALRAIAATLFALSIFAVGGRDAVAQGQFITERSDVALEEADTGISPLLGADTLSIEAGAIYTNSVFRVSGSNDIPMVGDVVRTIFAGQINRVLNGVVYGPIQFREASGQALDVVVIGSLEGTLIDISGALATVRFTAGRFALTTVPSGTFERRDPKTWGLTGANGTVLAEWVLKEPEDIQQGLGQQVGLVPADAVNVSAVSIPSVTTDGSLLVREDTGNSGIADLLHPNAPGDDLITTVTNLFGLVIRDEGVFSTFQQEIERQDLTPAQFAGDTPRMGLTGTLVGSFGDESPPLLPQGPAGPELSVLNFISNYGVLADFASNIGGGLVTDFTPEFDASGVNTTGDFRAFAPTVNLFPGIQPEIEAELIIEKTPDADDEPPPVFQPGDTAYFEIKVTNLGPATAANVRIDDDLPTDGDTLTWMVANENPNLGACTIDMSQHLDCAIGDLAPGAMFTVRVQTLIPNTFLSLLLAGTDFNATDGNLLLDNSEIPAGAGVPALDTKDWETFAPAIDCALNVGCVLDTPSGQTDNSYTQGAKEDDLSPAIDFGSIPPSKDDLLRWYFVQEILMDDVFLYLAWVRSNQLATATIDFELNQSGDLTGNGVNPVRTEGDALIVYDFQGGRVDSIGLLRWLTTADPANTDADCEANSGSVNPGCWGNRVDLLSSGVAEGAVNFFDNGTKKPGDDGYAVFDPIENPLTMAPFGTIEKARFGEAAINLTDAIAVDPTECIVFAQAFVKSRASGSSFTSALKDFIGPVPVDISTCRTLDNTAFAIGNNAPEVSDDGAIFVVVF